MRVCLFGGRVVRTFQAKCTSRSIVVASSRTSLLLSQSKAMSSFRNEKDTPFEASKGDLEVDEPFVSMKKTTVERESSSRRDVAHEYISHLPPDISVREYMPSQLSGAIFCGHLVTDLDSIAGSIGAAELYGGVASRASEVNSETAFALQHWGVEQPRKIEELLVEQPTAGVCLVDHQQMSQLNPAIEVHRIVGVIDHHALQNATIVTDMPIYIDIRPWGSMSSIIAHTFLTLRRRPKVSTAGMLLSAILSDTLNLQSPTTTEWDRIMVACLVELSGTADVQHLAQVQFKAKSAQLAGMSAHALVTGDQKVFTYKTPRFDGSIAFSVIETTDDAVILERFPELCLALGSDKEAQGVSLSFVAVVNIVQLRSTLLLLGDAEKSLALSAFPAGQLLPPGSHSHTPEPAPCTGVKRAHVTFSDDTPDVDIESAEAGGLGVWAMDLGRLVSRKKDFVPALSAAIKKGWSEAPSGRIHMSKSDVFDLAAASDE